MNDIKSFSLPEETPGSRISGSRGPWSLLDGQRWPVLCCQSPRNPKEAEFFAGLHIDFAKIPVCRDEAQPSQESTLSRIFRNILIP